MNLEERKEALKTNRLYSLRKYLDENMDVGAVSAWYSVNGEKIEYFYENFIFICYFDFVDIFILSR